MNDMSRAAKEQRNAYLREWRKKNPDKARAISARYWAKKAEIASAKSKEGDHGK